MTDLNELADRIEAAEVMHNGEMRDRVLDREIAVSQGWHRVEPRHNRGKQAWIAPGDFIGTHSDGSPICDSLHGTEMHREVPRYTASIDAAMTLVPEGWAIDRWCVWPGQGSSLTLLETRKKADGQWWRSAGMREVSAKAKTPALALVAAALRALKGEDDE